MPFDAANWKADGELTRTILLIESDPAALVARSLVLRCLGYTVLEVGSRGEAWRGCVEYGGPIHLILTEAVRDDYSSSEFIARLQLLCPQIRALFVVDASSVELAYNQIMPCECAFLKKPFRADVLAETIKGLLDGPKQRVVSSLS